jgi:uncharacterized protein (DUF1697 family)
MGKFISLLRGINVSGQKKIRMEDLRALYASLEFSNVESYIQSGNVVFESTDTDKENIRSQIESAILTKYGFAVQVFLLTGKDLARVVRNNPYNQNKTAPSTALYVTFLSEPLAAGVLDRLSKVSSGEDSFKSSDREVYLYCPGGYGRTKYTNSAIEKAAGIPATTRNWKTVNKLFEM